MIAVNQEKLNLKDKEDPFVKYYLEKTKFLKENGSTYRFRYPEHMLTPADQYERDSRVRQPEAVYLDAKYRFVHPEFEVEVQYYKTSVLREKGVLEFSPTSIHFKGSMTLTTDKDLDLIFFLVYVCPHAEKLKDFPGQNQYRRKNYYVLYDHEQALQAIQEREEKLAEVRTAIWHTKFGLPIGKLKIIAANFGVSATDKMKDAEVRQSLEAWVLGKTNGAYDWERINKFHSLIDSDGDTELGAAIQLAIDHNKIMLVNAGKNVPVAYWRYVDTELKICETGVAKSRGDKIQALKDYLDRYPEQAKILIETVK